MRLQSFCLAVIVLGFVSCECLQAAELQAFSGCKLVEGTGNDGDSFMAEVGGTQYRVRLYGVDCPETTVVDSNDARRVREQTRYFGLGASSNTINYGEQAALFTKKALNGSFTVYTAFSSAPGRSKNGRIYAYVTTESGHDLGEMLVQQGLARARGILRKNTSGIPAKELKVRLQDREGEAMLKRAGIWQQSNPERITELREQQRNEDNDLKKEITVPGTRKNAKKRATTETENADEE